MMLNDFTQLGNEKKAALLYNEGVYIGKRRVGTTRIILYQFEGFYAEIHYRKYRRDIEKIVCFATTAKLDPYLEEIHVEHLV
jgi:hypothetical protein